MSANSVLEDGSTVSRVDRAVYRVESLLTLLAGLVALGVMLLAVANILGRKIGDMANKAGWEWFDANFGPVPGYIDWTEQAVPAIAILGLIATQRDGGHIRMDIFVGKLKGRALWFFELISVVLMLLITLGLIYGTWTHFERSFDFAAPMWSRDSSVDIHLPIWPAKLLFPVVFGLFALRLVLQIWAYLRALASGAENPPAVPIPEDAATQALNEAKTVSGLSDDDIETEEAKR
jgi:TRAP-type C4-dicarboxylate transport system permease small subunit